MAEENKVVQKKEESPESQVSETRELSESGTGYTIEKENVTVHITDGSFKRNQPVEQITEVAVRWLTDFQRKVQRVIKEYFKGHDEFLVRINVCERMLTSGIVTMSVEVRQPNSKYCGIFNLSCAVASMDKSRTRHTIWIQVFNSEMNGFKPLYVRIMHNKLLASDGDAIAYDPNKTGFISKYLTRILASTVDAITGGDSQIKEVENAEPPRIPLANKRPHNNSLNRKPRNNANGYNGNRQNNGNYRNNTNGNNKRPNNNVNRNPNWQPRPNYNNRNANGYTGNNNNRRPNNNQNGNRNNYNNNRNTNRAN